jgi:glycosyltransferase involved in cell wall biosynthesis
VDINIHPCQFEGFGYPMLEDMACGTSVITTDCPTDLARSWLEARLGLWYVLTARQR